MCTRRLIRHRNLLSRPALLIVFLLLPLGALAQTAGLTGFVTDQSGAAVAGASVTLQSLETGIERTTTTNEEGYYALPLLPPGNYRLQAVKSGFKTFVRSGIRLEVQQNASVNVALEVGEISGQIEVESRAPLVAAEDASIGTVIDQRKLLELPLNGRNPLNLVTLAPGVTPNPRGPAASNINGGRDNTSDILLDGGPTTTTDQGDAALRPLLEGVAEFKVQTGAFGAEFGRAGGVVNVVTRSGGNDLHASLFEFLRNDAFDANNFFFNARGLGKAKLRYNQFGGTLGGPVWLPKGIFGPLGFDGRNRTFFFVALEYTRQQGVGLRTSTVPTALERMGDFSRSGPGGGPLPIFDPATTRPNPAGSGFVRDLFPNSIIPKQRLDPIALAILETAYPLPQNDAVVNNYAVASPANFTDHGYQVRFDHNFNSQHRLSVSYLQRDNQSLNPQQFPGRPGQGGGTAANNLSNGQRSSQSLVRYTASLRPNLLNEFIYSLLYFRNSLNPVSANQGWAERLGLRNVAPYLFPDVNPLGYNGVFGGNLSREFSVNHQFADNVTWVKGTHIIKTGFEWRPLYFSNQQPLGTAGSFTFDTQPTRNPALTGAAAGGNSIASLLLGVPSVASITVNDVKFGAYWQYYAGFVQDKWRVSPRLTLDYGVRWEFTRPRKERHNRQSRFDLARQELVFSGEQGVPETLFEGDYNNFAPRLGLAYAPFGNNKTAIRASFGMFYLPINNLAALGQFSRGFTGGQTFQTLDGGITFPLTLSTAFPVTPITRTLSPLANVSVIGPEYQTPYVTQWSLSLQQEVFGNTLLDVTYIGAKGTHLMLPGLNINQVPAELLGPGNAQLRRPYPQLGSIDLSGLPVGNSIYHGVQFKVERRFSAGLNLLGSYSLQKSIDDASGFAGFRTVGSLTIQDHHNLRAERSISTFDRTHNVVVAGLYELPVGQGKRYLSQGGVLGAVLGGWQVNGILALRSGVPLSMATVQNRTGSLGGGSRPDKLRSGVLPESERSITRWFDTTAYQLPPDFRFGTAPRTEPDLRGPGTATLDLSVFRNLALGEKVKLQVRGEAFNALNRVNFGNPSTTIGSPAAGTITAAGDARIIQLGMRLSF